MPDFGDRPLTLTQRRILWLMARFGTARIAGLTRHFAWGYDEEAGLRIRVYGDPEIFLIGRGLLEEAPSNQPGRYFRLTEAGTAKAKRVRRAPPGIGGEKLRRATLAAAIEGLDLEVAP